MLKEAGFQDMHNLYNLHDHSFTRKFLPFLLQASYLLLRIAIMWYAVRQLEEKIFFNFIKNPEK